jgi:hypothetical protein
VAGSTGSVVDVSTRLEISERLYQQSIVDLARILGWRTYHTFDSRRSAPGFPDLVLVKGERLVFAECKAARGKVSQAQRGWLEALSAVSSIEIYLWVADVNTLQAIRETLK